MSLLKKWVPETMRSEIRIVRCEDDVLVNLKINCLEEPVCLPSLMQIMWYCIGRFPNVKGTGMVSGLGFPISSGLAMKKLGPHEPHMVMSPTIPADRWLAYN
jgi:hypothetical protein